MNEIRIIVPGPPPRKNERHVIAHGRLINSEKFLDFASRFDFAWRQALRGFVIDSGAWIMTCTSYWPKWRHLDDVSVPIGDSDASVACVRDAMQIQKLIDNDGRIIMSTGKCMVSPSNERVEIQLWRVNDKIWPSRKRKAKRG